MKRPRSIIDPCSTVSKNETKEEKESRKKNFIFLFFTLFERGSRRGQQLRRGGGTVALIHRRLINHYVRETLAVGLLDWKRGVTTMNYGERMTDQLPRRALWRWPQRTTNSRRDLVKPLASKISPLRFSLLKARRLQFPFSNFFFSTLILSIFCLFLRFKIFLPILFRFFFSTRFYILSLSFFF